MHDRHVLEATETMVRTLFDQQPLSQQQVGTPYSATPMVSPAVCLLVVQSVTEHHNRVLCRQISELKQSFDEVAAHTEGKISKHQAFEILKRAKHVVFCCYNDTLYYQPVLS